MKTNELKRYDAYKPSGVEWLGEIPEHWEIFRIKNITNVFSRGVTPEYVENSDYRIVNQATFSKGYFDWGNAKFTSEKSVSNTNFAKAKIQKNDILLASTGGGVLGKVCHFELDADNYYADSHVTILRLYSYELSRFIYYLLSVNYNLINGILAQGSTNQTELQKSWLGNFLISFPPLSEQTAIAQFLDTKTALVDKAIELKEKQIALLKERRQAIIHQAVTKGLNPDVPMKDSGIDWIGVIPEHWEVKKLKYLIDIFGGFAFATADFKEVGIQLIKIANTYMNELCLDRQPTYLPESFLKSHNNWVVTKGDILISLTGTLGKRDYGFAILLEEEQKFLLNQRVAKISAKKNISTLYLLNILRSEMVLNQLYALPAGTKQANLSNDDILGIKVALPPSQDQKEIGFFIEKNNQKIANMISLKEQEIEKLKEYKASLINSAVTGKIKVTE